MLITLSRRNGICQSVKEIYLTGWLPWELRVTDVILINISKHLKLIFKMTIEMLYC